MGFRTDRTCYQSGYAANMKLHVILAFLIITGGCQPQPNTTAQSPPAQFVALDAGGMPAEVGNRACVADERTGLMWEAKINSAGLRHWNNTYSWYNPDESVGELDYRGLANGGKCTDSDCDTWSFVHAINDVGLCGFFDWRLPSRDELMSISELSRAEMPPTADPDFFPYMQSAEYWTGFDYSTQHESAWAWSFFYGHDRVDWKRSPKYVRLVRGTANNLASVKE